ncbi:MAG: hypothetical protein ACR2NU_14190 [Aeoliella sp.]
MTRLITLTALFLIFCVSPAFSQINKSKEFPNVFNSPAADSTPAWSQSVLQMEVVVKKGDADAEVQYANGTVVSKDGLLVSVLDEPGSNQAELGGIESASILMLDGTGVAAELMAYEPTYGVAIFRVNGLNLRPFTLSKAPLVANRRINWHTVYNRGPKTFLYSRPLRVHKAKHQVGETEDLCEVVCTGVSGLSADRTGSALVALDGTLVGIMGWHEHWNITPKNEPPQKKLAYAVPAHVIMRLLEDEMARDNHARPVGISNVDRSEE